MKTIYIFLASFLIHACGNTTEKKEHIKNWGKIAPKYEIKTVLPEIDTSALILKDRISPPNGFQRVNIAENSFAAYLRNLKLKPHYQNLKYHNGRTKDRNGIYMAVVDMEIGKKNLHQCADAIMRLRAEYFWNLKQYDKIHFNFTNGFRVDYSEWMNGKRIKVNGNKIYWVQTSKKSDTYPEFWNYMEIVFNYAGTLSLSKEMKQIKPEELAAGDVFIQGGSPGHAVLVLDVAINENTGEKLFLLGQSYMPAQDFQILINPENSELSPWYKAKNEGALITPEWYFDWSDLKRFGD